MNPVDIATRFPSIDSLATKAHWWKGLEFLLKEDIHWLKRFVSASTNGKSKDKFKKSLTNNIHHVTFKKDQTKVVL
jgi:hypothetical protein